MYEYFFDENEITSVQTPHEGVLYWMDKDEINDLEKHTISKTDPEAERQYNWYMEENRKPEKNLREEYEQYHGAFEDNEEYQKALEDKDRDTIQRIIFEYATS
eukprot:3934969-Amphidinium_carterae.1